MKNIPTSKPQIPNLLQAPGFTRLAASGRVFHQGPPLYGTGTKYELSYS